MMCSAMSITFHVPSFLRAFTAGFGEVKLSGSPKTVGEALEMLCEVYPGVRDRIVTEQGELRPHVNIFLGSESVRYSGGLATAMCGHDEISIVPAVSGGGR